MSSLFPVQCPELSAGNANVIHGFFTREGGVSKGHYKSLNVRLSSGDSPENVQENRARIARCLGLGIDCLAAPRQCHSRDVAIIGKNWRNNRLEVDGLVSAMPNLAIAVLTADCGPVLFCDGKTGIIGAAHAGWRGAVAGVLESTVEKMLELGAARENIRAALGPAISQQNYETGPEFIERLMRLDPGNARYFFPSANSGHACFDLPRYIVDRLANIGVRAQWTGHCTYADKDRFFSCRRAKHRGEDDYGVQMSAIAILDL